MRRARFVPLLAVISCNPPAPATTPPPQNPTPTADTKSVDAPARPHHYRGSIVVPGQGELEYFVELTPRDDGQGYRGSIDIPKQGAKGLELSDIAWSDEAVAFTLPVGAPARWSATVDEDGDLECSFSQGPLSLPCALEEIDDTQYAKLREPARPQTPKPPFPYEIREVEYQSGDIDLAGTLTVPEGEGPHPAVVLITGSGAQDRDESIVGHKPFWVWADHLSRNGIAVLRSDDRGVGGSSGSLEDATAGDTAEDALAAVRFLATQPDIDKARIGLMGHSEGGLVAPIAAARSKKDVAFIVLLAAPGVPGKDVIEKQAADIGRASGASDADIARAQQQREQLWTMIEAGGDEDELRAKIEAFLIEDTKKMTGDEADVAVIEQKAKLEATRSSSRRFRDFLFRDPKKALRQVKVPVLAITGGKDLQVDAETNLGAIEKALEKARNRDVTVQTLEGLNHLFQTAQTGSPAEYAAIEETIDPAALQIVTRWIRERTQLAEQ